MNTEDGFGGDIESAMRQLQQVERAIVQAMPEAVKAGAEVLKEESAHLAPVRRGRLKASAKDEAGEVDAISAAHRVYYDEFYAKFQEFGTSKMGAQPFLTPAAEMNKARIEEAIADVIRPATEGAVLTHRGTLT